MSASAMMPSQVSRARQMPRNAPPETSPQPHPTPFGYAHPGATFYVIVHVGRSVFDQGQAATFRELTHPRALPRENNKTRRHRITIKEAVAGAVPAPHRRRA